MKNNRKPTKRYMESYAALYGDGKPPKPRPKRVVNDTSTEEADQCRLVQWLREKNIWFYAIPNGRKDAIEGAKFKRQGAVAGVPDICVPYMRKGFGALFIEMKRISGGVLSDAQRQWIDFLNAQGYKALVCRGFEHAKNTIEGYLALPSA